MTLIRERKSIQRLGTRLDGFRKEARETIECASHRSCQSVMAGVAEMLLKLPYGQSDCLSASSFGAIDVADYHQERGQSDEEKYRVLFALTATITFHLRKNTERFSLLG